MNAEDARWVPDYRRAGRNVANHHSPGANHRAISNRDVAKHHGVRAEVDVVPDHRYRSTSDRLTDRHTVSQHASLAQTHGRVDHHAVAVIDTQPRPRLDFPVEFDAEAPVGDEAVDDSDGLAKPTRRSLSQPITDEKEARLGSRLVAIPILSQPRPLA